LCTFVYSYKINADILLKDSFMEESGNSVQYQNTLLSNRCANIQGVSGGKVSILGGHSIGHSKQKYLYEHVSYSERFPR